jgi:periplasmic divalent cation tolerance protein
VIPGEGFVQVETTVASAEAAAALADAIVGMRLAACAHVAGPIRSTYWWDDAVQTDEEYVVVFKTRAALATALRGAVEELHDYDVPAVVVVDVAGGSSAYLDWIAAQTRRI